MKKLSAFLMFFFCFTAILFAQDIFTLAKSGTPEEIQAAIGAGAKVNDRDNKGMTPLMWAALNNQNPEVITALVKAGAKVNDRDNIGVTPLMFAASNNRNPEVITAFLKAGADPTITSKEGKTALDYAQDNAKIKGTSAFEALRSATVKAK